MEVVCMSLGEYEKDVNRFGEFAEWKMVYLGNDYAVNEQYLEEAQNKICWDGQRNIFEHMWNVWQDVFAQIWNVDKVVLVYDDENSEKIGRLWKFAIENAYNSNDMELADDYELVKTRGRGTVYVKAFLSRATNKFYIIEKVEFDSDRDTAFAISRRNANNGELEFTKLLFGEEKVDRELAYIIIDGVDESR
jgi:hypothetical protein